MDSRSNLNSDMKIKCGDFGVIDLACLPSVPFQEDIDICPACCARIGSDGSSKVDHRTGRILDRSTEDDDRDISSSRSDFWRKNANNSVVVYDLSEDTTDAELDYLFTKCGHVARVEALTHRLSGGSTVRYGLVAFSTREEAVKAIEKYNGYWFDHTNFRVGWLVFAEPQVNRSKNNEENNRSYSVVVTQMPRQTTDTELDHLFNRFGHVIRVGVATIVKETSLITPKGKKISLRSRFGFVTFANREDAGKAIEELDGYCHRSVILRLRRATPLPHCPVS